MCTSRSGRGTVWAMDESSMASSRMARCRMEPSKAVWRICSTGMAWERRRGPAFSPGLLFFFSTLQVETWRVTAEILIGCGGKRCFVDDAIPFFTWEILCRTPCFGEKVVDIDRRYEVGVNGYGCSGNKIFAAALHQQNGQPLVGCGNTRL